MQTLVSISDLENNSPEANKEFVARAMNLSRWYDQWKQQDPGGYTYTVEVGASRKRTAGIHASEVSTCPRKAVYTMTGMEQHEGERKVNMQRRFNMGHAVHAMTQKECELLAAWLSQGDQTVTFEDEVGIHPKLQEVAAQWGLYSSCDGVFTFAYQNVPYLRIGLEIKTKSALEYEKLKAPEPSHLEQTCIYMAALDLPLMWTLYYNKSNSNYTPTEPPFLFKFDSNLWQSKLIPRFREFHRMAQTGEVAPAVEGFHCQWCPYTWTCQPKTLNSRQPWGTAKTMQVPGALRLPGR